MDAVSSLQTTGSASSYGQQTSINGSGQNAQQVQQSANSTKELEKSQDKKNVEDLKKELSSLTEQLNKEMSPLNFNVKFGFNDKIDEMYVSVTEKKTNKLIRKIPSDEAVNLMEKMREIVGMIFDKKA